jgi:ATPase subunit of ABC transporter with duplicated ATPase domains
MDIIELGKEKIKPIFSFSSARTTGKIVIDAKDLVLGYEEPLTAPLNLRLERGQKIAVKGVNGLGESTLLKTLLGIQPPIAGTVELEKPRLASTNYIASNRFKGPFLRSFCIFGVR